MAQTLVDSGELTEEEAAFHPSQSHLLALLGGSGKLDVHIEEAELDTGDGFLLFSDGVWAHIGAREMAGAILQDDLQAVADGLVQLAVRRGGTQADNASVALACLR